nr:MAG TPA: hypothetical protein [Caudoviricetes sp.]
MRHVDKYKDELIKMANESNIVQVSCRGDVVPDSSKANGLFCSKRATSYFVKWLYEECTFKLSTLEHELLKHFYRDGYKYIARDECNSLYLYKSSPIKEVDVWTNEGEDYEYKRLRDFKNEFSFIRWEDTQPTPIQDILENCEVTDYD